MFADVVARPHDDAPRRAFAQHVAASHPYRTRFIELQLERIQADVAAQRWRSEPSPEEHELVRAHAAEWTQMIAPMIRPIPSVSRGGEFNRGFIERVRTTAEIMNQMSGRLFELSPILHLEITRPERDGGATLRAILGLPVLRQLDSLQLSGWDLTDADARELAKCDQLANLSTLDLRANKIGRAGVEALAQSPVTRGILHIDLSLNAVEAPQVSAYDDEGNHLLRVTSLGQALEAKYGTIPWVHIENLQGADLYHRRYVAQAYRASH